MADPETRSANARAAALHRWATTVDRNAATAPAREGLRRKFDEQVPPEIQGPQRERSIENLMTEHLIRMRMARRNRRATVDELADAIADEAAER